MALFPARRATISCSNAHTCCAVADSYSLWLGFLCPCLCLYADMLLGCCVTSHCISPAQAPCNPTHGHEGEKEKNAPRPPNKYPRSLDGMCGACAAVYSTGFGMCTALAASVMRERQGASRWEWGCPWAKKPHPAKLPRPPQSCAGGGPMGRVNTALAPFCVATPRGGSAEWWS